MVPDSTSNAFYDALAAAYDEMIPFDTRFDKVVATTGKLLAQHPATRALDVATGTGLHALALAAHGVETVGVDLSAGMIEQARQRGLEKGLDVEWRVAPMQQLGADLAEPFNLILCLGNSLPHLLSWVELGESIASFAALLAPGGRLIVQLLNYDRVLAARERIVAITRTGTIEYVRFYDFLDEHHLRFNVLRIDWAEAGAPHHCLESVQLHPWKRREVTAALEGHGFREITASADLLGTPHDPDRDQSLVLHATR